MDYSPFDDTEMQSVFDRYPPEMRAKLMRLRELIFEVAAGIEGVGELEETLKWNQPSYLTAASRAGTTIRIDEVKGSPQHYALFVNCQTSLVENWRLLFPALEFDGNRAIIFDLAEELPTEAVKDAIGLALTYHLRKKK